MFLINGDMMEEPRLKKKNLFNRIINNQILVTGITTVLMMLVIVGSSYAIFSSDDAIETNDVVVSSGNLEVVISSESDTIILDYETLGVSDIKGMDSNGYTFSIKNTGSSNIAYYEIRIVDKEYEVSNLPHKAINYSIKKDNSEYSNPYNLGDAHGYIFVGRDLLVDDSHSFDLKLWVNEMYGYLANNKSLKASLEVTLYNEIPLRNYLIYNTMGGSYIPKSNVLNKRITNLIPIKEGYTFLGWSTYEDSSVCDYLPGSTYNNKLGLILYAVWKEEK